jgi:hypothetical protein
MNSELVNIIGEMAGLVPLGNHRPTLPKPFPVIPAKNAGPEHSVKSNGV